MLYVLAPSPTPQILDLEYLTFIEFFETFRSVIMTKIIDKQIFAMNNFRGSLRLGIFHTGFE